MEKNYCDLPDDLINIERVAVVAPESEKKSGPDNFFTYLFDHPIVVLFGVVASCFICVGIVAYFLIQKTSEHSASIETIQTKITQSPSKKSPQKKFGFTESEMAPEFMPIAAPGQKTSPTPSPLPTPIEIPTLAPVSQSLTPIVVEDVAILRLSAAPTLAISQSQLPDTQPPFSMVMSPQSGDIITSKNEGKVCATLAPPSDNVTPPDQIITFYAFDSDEYTTVQNVTFVCRDTLPNGAHALKYKSKDGSGNEEVERVINFLVEIEGN